MSNAKKDFNSVATSMGVSDVDGVTMLPLRINPTTGRLLVSAVLGSSYMTNPMTTLGDTVYGGASGAPTRLAGDISNTRKFLRELSVAGVATAPAWDTLQSGDIPDISATYETKSNKATTFGTINDTLYPTVKAVNDAIISAVVGLLDYRGSYDASGNTFPTTGGSGTAGAILKGDFWIISVGGTLGTTVVYPGDMVIALQDTPGQTASNWNIIEYGISYVPENAANKVTSISGSSTDVQYPSAKLLYDQLALKAALAGSTGQAFSVSTLDVGNADTTISRVSAGVISVEGKNVAIDGQVNARRIVELQIVAIATDTDTTSGIGYFNIPYAFNGMNLVRAQAYVDTAGTTNATTIQVRNMTKYASNDALSSAISIASGGTVGTAGTVDTSYDDVATNDLLKIYVTGQSTTKPKGLRVCLEYSL